MNCRERAGRILHHGMDVDIYADADLLHRQSSTWWGSRVGQEIRQLLNGEKIVPTKR